MVAWLTIIALAAIFIWSCWTLLTGLAKAVTKLTNDDPIEIPQWIETVNPSQHGPDCVNCGGITIVTQHDERLTGFLCPQCSAYGLAYPEFIEWQIPGKGVAIQSFAPLDPTCPSD